MHQQLITGRSNLLVSLGASVQSAKQYCSRCFSSESSSSARSLNLFVKKALRMGFRPLSAPFMKALHVMLMMDASKWGKWVEFYRKCSWTEDDFFLAFRKDPLFMQSRRRTL
ncbi:hypothetical protein ACFX11_046475 [Malus domestica]|uniref:Uncharacterized protein n=1 Tax=Malus domestica TaxID=3750 RepID=A0A498J5R8_MALDO|nr:hypothetical protein DVH24_000400 [Malus domestica]